jgi:hypothetical protein
MSVEAAVEDGLLKVERIASVNVDYCRFRYDREVGKSVRRRM